MVSRRALIRSLSAALLPGVAYAQQRPLVLIGSDGWLYPGWEWTSELDQAQVEMTTALVTYAGELLASRGTMLLVFVLPSRARLYPDHLPLWAKVDETFLGRYRRIVDRLLTGGVAVLDGLNILTAVASRWQVFSRTDQHWILYASEAAARRVAELLHEAFPLAASPTGGARPGMVRIETRPGDLVALLPTALRERYPPERFRLRDYSLPGGLLDTLPQADIAVLGDSAVKPELGFSGALSARLRRPVDLFWRQGDIGPWVALQDYVASERFQNQPPAYLVWELHEYYFESPPDRAGWWRNSSLMPPAEWRQRLFRSLE